MDTIKILILEHDPCDLELLLHVLKKSNLDYQVITVETRESYEQALLDHDPDIILSDYSLPSFDGLTAFKIKEKTCPDTPFMIVSGTIGEENAVDLIKKGVTDYVLKERMYQVNTKIKRALKEARNFKQKTKAEKELEDSRNKLQKIMDTSLDMICTFDENFRFVSVSEACRSVLGYTPDELIGRNALELIHPDDIENTRSLGLEVSSACQSSHFENRYIRKNGKVVPIFWSYRWDDHEKLSYCIARDASAIKKAEDERTEHARQISNILESITDGFFSVDRNWVITYWNKEAEHILGREREEVIGRNLWEVYKETIPLKFYSEYHRVMAYGVSSSFEEYFEPLKAWIQVSAFPSKDGLSVYFKDITELKRGECIKNLEKEVLEQYTYYKSGVDGPIRLLLKGLEEIHKDFVCCVLGLEDKKPAFLFSLDLPEKYIKSIKAALNQDVKIYKSELLLKTEISGSEVSECSYFENEGEISPSYGLNPCFDYSISDSNNDLQGRFVVFLKSSRDLTEAEKLSLDRAKYVLKYIVESHVAERALRESEEKYRDLFHLSPLPLWVYDPETYRFLNVNAAAIRHYGYSKEEFLSMSIKDIRPEDDLKDLEIQVENSKKNGSLSSGTFTHFKKNGEKIQVLIQATLIRFGEKKARLVVATDITEKSKAEAALHEREKRFKALVQESSDYINILDEGGRYLYANPATTLLTGLEPEVLYGKNAFAFVHDDDKEMINRALSNILNLQNRMEIRPFRFKNKNGECRWLQSVVTNRLNDPAVQGIIINSRDITESINYIHAIEEQNAQLRDIAWVQSHVVRAPLARIMGLIDLLANYENEKEESVQLLAYITSSANELDDVIRDIVRKSEQAENIPKKTKVIL